MIDHARLSMPLGEAIFTQRAIRKFRPDPIPPADLRLIIEAAVRAPNGGNRQIGRFLVLTDRALIREFGALYREAWWAKRKDEKGWTRPADIPADDKNYRAAMGLADRIKDAPCVVLAYALPPGSANSVIPAVQNLMLAARAGHRLHADDAAPERDGPRRGAPRHAEGRDLPLLHPARLPRGALRPQRPPADGRDDVPQPLGRRRPVGVRGDARGRVDSRAWVG